ncbi:MAG TPA: LPS assembly lipoprotein LptE [Casimicrobiaceae bacterium]
MSWSERGARAARRAAIGIVVVLSASLASCGFHLRGQASYSFHSIYVNGAGSPPLAKQLDRALEATGSARVVPTAKEAEVVLDLTRVADDKEVLSLSGAGGVLEYQLIKRVEFRLHGQDGAPWLPPAEITLRRTYTFNETEVLAREAQEQRLLHDMQTDAVYQIIRRLQAAHKPG